ncbi:MAG: hypothetical protein ACM31E_10045 [Fibrobacterota bacterium]
MKPRILTIAALFTFLSMQCTDVSVSGGGGSSETINAKIIINDTVVTVTNDPANSELLSIEAFSTNYHPYEKTGFAAKSALGNTSKSVVLPAPGAYNFRICSEDRDLSCFIQNKTINKGDRDTVVCVLYSECNVKGKLVSRDSQTVNKKYVVAIQGSPFMCVTDEAQTFTLGTIPRGNYTMSIRPKEQRLFIAHANYDFSINEIAEQARLDVVVP